MSIEINDVRTKLKEMQEDIALNRLKEQLSKFVYKLNVTCQHIKIELFVVKKTVKSKAAEICSEFKRRGRTALSKVYEIFDVKAKMVNIRSKVKDSQEEVNHSIDKMSHLVVG